MDSFEFNKIAAAILTTALVFIGIKEMEMSFIMSINLKNQHIKLKV